MLRTNILGFELTALPFAALLLLLAGAPQGASYGPPPVSNAAPSEGAQFFKTVSELPYGVELQLSVVAGAATRWNSAGNPLFHDGELVRPVSVYAIVTWREQYVGSTHDLSWYKLDSKEGFGASFTVLGDAFSKEPGVAPLSQLYIELRPVNDWGKFRKDTDLLATVKLEPVERRREPEEPK